VRTAANRRSGRAPTADKRTGGIADYEIPDMLQDVLTESIDRFPEEAERILQNGSVIRRIFRVRVL
jgi:hypothetical protein